ncbi:uncharacterized protein LOC131447717 [Solea solea]|uniref:uncharacterized protein LOC131447717 n=1 Tax=Solea solea TaxID=90069 RepID=UPI00272B4D9B|nr:uncharacterized protein LOC131447717 [Solea solea]
MFPKPRAPQREEMSTIQVKNTALHLNGQNVRLAAKNDRVPKTPGLCLSVKHGKEAVGQLTASPPTQEATAQLHLSLLKSPRPDVAREAENQHVRGRPVKLDPLELPEEVREAQRQKLQCVQQEAKTASHKKEVTPNEPRSRPVKSWVRQRPVKAAVCPPASPTILKAQQQHRSLRPQRTRSGPTVVCQGTPAPLCSKPAPPSSPLLKPRAPHDGEAIRPNPSSLQQETGRRRPRLRRAQCLKEDHCNSNMSTRGLSADDGKLAQGVQGTGQQTEGALRGHPHADKGINEPPAASCEYRRVQKSHQESAEGGDREHALDSDRPSASNWRLKRKKKFMTKQNTGLPL